LKIGEVKDAMCLKKPSMQLINRNCEWNLVDILGAEHNKTSIGFDLSLLKHCCCPTMQIEASLTEIFCGLFAIFRHCQDP